MHEDNVNVSAVRSSRNTIATRLLLSNFGRYSLSMQTRLVAGAPISMQIIESARLMHRMCRVHRRRILAEHVTSDTLPKARLNRDLQERRYWASRSSAQEKRMEIYDWRKVKKRVYESPQKSNGINNDVRNFSVRITYVAILGSFSVISTLRGRPRSYRRNEAGKI